MTQPTSMPFLHPGTIGKSEISDYSDIIDSIAMNTSDRQYRVMAADCPAGITVESLIDHLTEHIADIALALWPDWFETNPFDCIHNSKTYRSSDFIESHFEKFFAYPNDISKPWLKDVMVLCRKNRKPLLDKYPKQIQVSFLAKPSTQLT